VRDVRPDPEDRVKVLVTGAAGFVGHHLCEHVLKTTDWELVCLDRLDESGNLNRLTGLDIWRQERARVRVIHHDLKAEINGLLDHQLGRVDVVFHLAAASHVDRSIENPLAFVHDNVVGTANLLDWARRRGDLGRLVYMNTDEIFGPADQGQAFGEWDRHAPKNPYAASKACADDLCIAFHNTYGLPVLTAICMNVYGQRQHGEKYVPSTIRKVRDGELVIIHADSTRTMPGSRFYIHARNVAAALLFVLEHGVPGEKYNIVGEREVSNLEMAELIAAYVGRPLQYDLVDFHSSRPGHDLHYRLSGERLAEMGWKLPVGFEESLETTVRWTLEHPEWLA
jgi:dTDP-glucose 4,6-dehydratase